jgi:hypothetical protein
VTPCSSSTHSIPFSRTRALFPAALMSSNSAARLASPSTAPTTAPHPQSRAQTASPSLIGAPQPIQSRSSAPEQPDHSADELPAPPPLGLAVNPLIHHLLALAEHPVSTTSSRRSFPTTSPPPSGTLATGTPSTPLELRRPLGFAAVTLLQLLPASAPTTPVPAVSHWSFSPTCPSPPVSPLAGFWTPSICPLLNPDQGLGCKN